MNTSFLAKEDPEAGQQQSFDNMEKGEREGFGLLTWGTKNRTRKPCLQVGRLSANDPRKGDKKSNRVDRGDKKWVETGGGGGRHPG